LSLGDSTLIYADKVIDSNGISRVWAVVTPPDYTAGSPDIPVTDLPSIELTPVGNDRFEARYNHFSSSGTYNIAVFALDGRSVISLPKTTKIHVAEPEPDIPVSTPDDKDEDDSNDDGDSGGGGCFISIFNNRQYAIALS